MNVVIVESPAKAKTINKYLGKDYKVMASYGHVRDLPSREGSVLPDEDFALTWHTDPKSKKQVKEIAAAVAESKKLILATDPDREGEAISWHLLELLEQKNVLDGVDVERVVFNAVTKRAVLDAMEHPRHLNSQLVNAYLARRALDYLVGFTLSPVLWRKLPGSRSAGRVQSVALRLICDRELEIEAFISQEYWTIDALVTAQSGDIFKTRLVTLEGEKLKKFDLSNEEAAAKAKQAIQKASFRVALVKSQPTKRNPPPPFTTSTLQQEVSRKLGFSASRTMQIAQQLYEGIDTDEGTTGLITYMRTDGIQMTGEAVSQARAVIRSEFGDRYVPGAPRVYKNKAKNAQEAHEAIRPTDFNRLPKDIGSSLNNDQRRLYELIWQRGLASQMANAELERTTIDLESADRKIGLRATGTVVLFNGFLRLYQEGRDDNGNDAEADSPRPSVLAENKRYENGNDAEAGYLPKVGTGQDVSLGEIKPDQHFTEPPPRFSEATLVKKLEELGIGRPSTYASILSVLRDRNYVHMDKNRFIPEDKGRLVTAFLESFFAQYVQYDFTADLEEKLDQVSAGELDWKEFLRAFWKEFHATVESTSESRITDVLDALNEVLGSYVFPPRDDGSPPRKCTSCEDGLLSIKVGRFGAFVGCSNYPECKLTRALTATNGANTGPKGDIKILGDDPDTGLEVSVRDGRFGAYVQLGDTQNGEKPKRVGIPKTMDPQDMNIERALALLSLPREVGLHPDTQKPIVAGIGRFGPYVMHDGTYANLKDPEEVFIIGLNRAVTLIAEKIAGSQRQGRTQKTLKKLGDHPTEGGAVNVLSGRYGPYVKHGKINVSLSADVDPQSVTLEQAVKLIAAKAKKSGIKKKNAPKTKTAKEITNKPNAAKEADKSETESSAAVE